MEGSHSRIKILLHSLSRILILSFHQMGEHTETEAAQPSVLVRLLKILKCCSCVKLGPRIALSVEVTPGLVSLKLASI